MSTMQDEAPEALRSVYEADLPPASFTVDEAMRGGRRRRRRRQAVHVAGGAFAVAAIAGVVATGTSLAGGGGEVQPAARPAASPAAGRSCTTDMGECAWRIGLWGKGVGVVYNSSARFTLDPKGGPHWEKGTWRLDAPLTSDNGGLRTTGLAITLSPSTTVPDGSRVDWAGFRKRTLRLTSGEIATGYEESGGVKATATWLVPARPGVHPAVEVGFTAVDQVDHRAAVPAAAGPQRVLPLLDILTGPGRTDVPPGQREDVNGPQPARAASAAVADPKATVLGWLGTIGHAEAANLPRSERQGQGWAVPSFAVGGVEVSVQVAPGDALPAAGPVSGVTTPGGLQVRREHSATATGSRDDYTLADERIAGRTVTVSLVRALAAPGSVTEVQALRLVDALAGS